jgi:hypothetical protein
MAVRSNPNNTFIVNKNFTPVLDGVFEAYRPLATDSAEMVNNKYGILRKEVENEINRELNNTFLILKAKNKKIYDIVNKLKNDFILNQNGDKITLTSQQAKRYSDEFALIINQIDTSIKNMSTLPVNKKTFKDIQKYQITDDIPGETYKDHYKTVSNTGAKTINDIRVSNLIAENEKDEVDVKTPGGLTQVQNRLENCSILEHLYLRKHSELLNTFALTVNIYDKYTIALKLLMFLIKYLVKYNSQIDDGDGELKYDCKVKIPKPVIKDLKSLLDDQSRIQAALTTIKNNVNTSSGFMGNSEANVNIDLATGNMEAHEDLIQNRGGLPLPRNSTGPGLLGDVRGQPRQGRGPGGRPGSPVPGSPPGSPGPGSPPGSPP